MNTPSHCRPQTRRANLRVVKAINDAEQAMLPPGFNAEAVAMEAMHFQSAATPLAHDSASITRLREQVQKAQEDQANNVRGIDISGDWQRRNLQALAQLPLAHLDDQHRAVKVAKHKPLTRDPLRLDDAMPVLHRVHAPMAGQKSPPFAQPPKPVHPQAQDQLGERIRRNHLATSASDRRSIFFVVAVYLALIVCVALLSNTN